MSVVSSFMILVCVDRVKPFSMPDLGQTPTAALLRTPRSIGLTYLYVYKPSYPVLSFVIASCFSFPLSPSPLLSFSILDTQIPTASTEDMSLFSASIEYEVVPRDPSHPGFFENVVRSLWDSYRVVMQHLDALGKESSSGGGGGPKNEEGKEQKPGRRSTKGGGGAEGDVLYGPQCEVPVKRLSIFEEISRLPGASAGNEPSSLDIFTAAFPAVRRTLSTAGPASPSSVHSLDTVSAANGMTSPSPFSVRPAGEYMMATTSSTPSTGLSPLASWSLYQQTPIPSRSPSPAPPMPPSPSLVPVNYAGQHQYLSDSGSKRIGSTGTPSRVSAAAAAAGGGGRVHRINDAGAAWPPSGYTSTTSSAPSTAPPSPLIMSPSSSYSLLPAAAVAAPAAAGATTTAARASTTFGKTPNGSPTITATDMFFLRSLSDGSTSGSSSSSSIGSSSNLGAAAGENVFFAAESFQHLLASLDHTAKERE